MVGDLRYGRTVHSLSHALSRFGANLTFIAPASLSMPEEIIEDLQKSGANITVSEDLVSNLPTADVIYMTRIQKERFPDEDEYLKVAGIYKLSRSNLKDVKESMIIMHPLPRIDEIHPNVDNTPHARYFDQAFNGVVARMALLCRVFGVSVPKAVGK
jgi:aspartate carbamoyltransferase catalytic subunit